MRINRKSIVSLLLTAVMLLSLCACDLKNRNEEAALFANSYCDAVKSGDISKIEPFITDSQDLEEIKKLLEPEDLNSEQQAYFDAISSTLDYSFSEVNYDKELKSCFVSYVWTVGSYYSDAANNADNLADFKTALASSDKIQIPIVLEVDVSEEAMRIKNGKFLVQALYVFEDAENNVMPGLLSDFYTDGDWVLAPNGYYSNTKEIGVRINFDKELFNYRFVPGYMYTVAYGSEVIYVSEILKLEEDSVRMDLTSEIAGSDYLNEYGFLIDGTYTIIVFDEHSKEIATFTCDIENEEIEKDEIEFEDHKKDYYLSNLVYEFKDSDMMGDSYVYMTGWWDYDGTSVGKSAFASNTATLGFSLAVSSDNETELYYEYYYSEESDFEGIEEEGPLFESSCKPTIYQDQACYDLDYTPSEAFEPGFYGLVVYSDATKSHIVLVASCIVVEETSDDVID